LFYKAYSIISTAAKGLSGFKATGIYPLNPNEFTDEDFQHEWKVQDTSSEIQIYCQPVHSEVLLLTNEHFTLIL
jgi:hypothetical protein